MRSDDVTIVIVTFNSEELMRTLDQPLINGYRTCFVDNASRDDTLRIVRERFGGADIIELDRNVGYGRANNAALRRVRTRYALVLNPDVRISRKDVEDMLRLADEHPEYSLIGAGGHEQVGVSDNSPIVSADFVSGSCMLFRMSDFSEVGFFDENFFMYYEDVDLCLRLKEANLNIGIIRNTRISHKEGMSTGQLSNSALERSWIWGASSWYFYDKHRKNQEGRRARKKILQWQKRKLISLLTFDRSRYAEACARTKGYSDARQHGPHIAFENYFTGGKPRTSHCDAASSGAPEGAGEGNR